VYPTVKKKRGITYCPKRDARILSNYPCAPLAFCQKAWYNRACNIFDEEDYDDETVFFIGKDGFLVGRNLSISAHC
jgi:hypothetical protein